MLIVRIILLATLLGGCAMAGPAPRVIEDTTDLLVRLEPAGTCAGDTEGTPLTHPVHLSGQQVQSLLASFLAREKIGLLPSFVQTSGTPRLFDGAVLDRLTPPVQEALAQARPEEAVVFLHAARVSDSRSTVTSGAMSIRGEVLSMSLFNFRHPVRITLSDVGATDRLSDVRETLRYIRNSPCVSLGEQDFALFFGEPVYQTEPRSGSLTRYPERTLSIAFRDFLAAHPDKTGMQREALDLPPQGTSDKEKLQTLADLKQRIAELERANQALVERARSSGSSEGFGGRMKPITGNSPAPATDTEARLLEIMKRLETRVSELERILEQGSAR